MPVTSNMQQSKILLVILFLSKKKFHAKQIFVLTGFMKFSPGDNRGHLLNSRGNLLSIIFCKTAFIKGMGPIS